MLWIKFGYFGTHYIFDRSHAAVIDPWHKILILTCRCTAAQLVSFDIYPAPCPPMHQRKYRTICYHFLKNECHQSGTKIQFLNVV